MNKPVILLALALAAGILLGQVFLYFPCSVIMLVALGVAVGITAYRQRRTVNPLLMTGSAFLTGAVLLVTAATSLPPDHYSTRSPGKSDLPTVTGRISSPLDRDPGRTAFTLAVDHIDGRAASGTLRVTVRDDSLTAGYDDRVSLAGRLNPPRGFRNPGGFDYPAYLARQGVYAVLSIKRGSDVRVLEQGTGIRRAIQTLRERIRQAFLASMKGEGAAMLLAMTIGEEGSLTDDLRERFMAAGVTHIISISGSHLGMVAVLCFWFTRHALFLLPERSYHWITIHADPRKVAALVTVVPVTFYAFLAGGQIATIRSLIMILAALAAVVLDRDRDLLPALSLAALITLLIDPQALFDISFQLSYLSVLSIAFVVSTWTALELHADTRAGKIRNRALLLFVISCAAALATGPLVAHYFNRFSFAGVIANMVVVPFAGAVVVPLGLLCGILSLLTGHLPLASVNQFIADMFVSLVSFFARIPFSSIHLPSPGILLAAGYFVLLAASALLVRARLFAAYRPLEASLRPPRQAVTAMAIAGIVVVAAVLFLFFNGHGTRITFLDVGQGDCAIVETASGRNILIDGGGTRDNRFDIGRAVLAPYLWNRGIRTIDLVVLSHPHPDHMNGLLAVLHGFSVREVWGSGLDASLPGYAEFQRLIKDRGIPFRTVSAGDEAKIGDARLAVLHPGPAFDHGKTKAYAAENDRSLVIRMHTPGRTSLFTGDIHASGETILLRNVSDLASDLVKVPHHGSRTSSTRAFIAAVRPKLAVFTVGDGNVYRHPSEEVVERYRSAGSRVFRTDRQGAVMVRDPASGQEVLTWSELMLRRIAPSERNGWWAIERENWKRLALRTAGI
ncbi:MAG: DNA internalization-related competence protein ComEC/Rec2 [Nitrospirota bacterium]